MTNFEHEMFDDQYLVVGDCNEGMYEILDWSGQEMANRFAGHLYARKDIISQLVNEGFQVEFA